MKKKQNNKTAEKFVKETILLIEEKGGSRNVNLREIAKRVGCAHTNAYNYFYGFEDLMWKAFDEVIKKYAIAMIGGLDNQMSGNEYYSCLVRNLVDFAINNPGIYRFIASDPIDTTSIPESTLQRVIRLKQYFIDVIFLISNGTLSEGEAQNTADIILAYLDGETFNLINGRTLPNDDIKVRVIGNAELLFTALTSSKYDGIDLKNDELKAGILNFPVLEINIGDGNEIIDK